MDGFHVERVQQLSGGRPGAAHAAALSLLNSTFIGICRPLNTLTEKGSNMFLLAAAQK